MVDGYINSWFIVKPNLAHNIFLLFILVSILPGFRN